MNQSPSGIADSDQDQPGKQDAAARWRKLLEDQRVSGLPVSAFCRERGIPQSSLFAWRKRLKLGVAAGMFKAVKLAPESKRSGRAADVHADADGIELSASSFVELCLRGERRLIVRPGFDRQLLLNVVSTLESLT